MSETGPKFLPEKYPDLAGSKAVDSAVRKSVREGKPGPKTKEDRIEAYLDRLERLALDPEKKQKRKMLGDESRPRALMMLREMLMNKYVRPHKEKMAQGAARVEERAAREMGVQVHYGEQELQQRGDIAVEDLEKSLDQWIAYLSDANEPYPTWFRYYAFRNILNLSDYDKDKGEFTRRTPGSFRLFPDIDRGALGYIQERIEAAQDPEKLARLIHAQEIAGTPKAQLLTKEKAAKFAKLSFAKQYAEGIGAAGEITPEMRQQTKGKWVKYQKGTDPTALWASLQNKGTAWCTKGFGTAQTQLQGGDFYVYYTLDRQGKPTIPRIAIRMQEDQIGEVRGVSDNQQNLEGNMAEIAREKMQDLPGAERYLKASADMQRLTTIEKKMNANAPLDRDELVFLYEIAAPIEGFGYQKDPRIAELRAKRNPKEDAPIVFECTPNEIAWSKDEIKENTKAYIGPLFPKIFETLGHLEHIYTEFPAKRIERRALTTHPEFKTADDYRGALIREGFQISQWADDILSKIKFKELKNHTIW